jgi:tetratricopeptide (TPR) repeat protein
LSESVLGRQEAALLALLAAFREGDLEAALRRALPLGEEGGRGGQAAQDANLPVHKPFYSLADLLGGRNSRPSVWLGGGRVQVDLAVEYRKAAEAATARGDYRRAAFIYGKLLRTYQLAAAVLSRGGLHHDAAVLYLEKVGDELMAAREFAAAGEVDQAVALYRPRGEHALAGDVLRQAGEEEAAFAEYQLAATRLADDDQNHAAGELMLKRAGRPDTARA